MRILVTDPDPDVRRLACWVLALVGHTVEQMPSAGDAWVRGTHCPRVDLVLLAPDALGRLGTPDDVHALAVRPGGPIALMAGSLARLRCELWQSEGRTVQLRTIDRLRAAVRVAGLHLLG